MFDNLQNTQIGEMSEEDLLAASGEVKDLKTKTDDKKDDKKEDVVKKEIVKKETDTEKVVGEISDKDLEIAMNAGDDDDDDDKKGDEEEKEKKEEEKEKKKDDKPEEGEVAVEIKDFLKARVDLLIKSGSWKDFEGREEVEWDEDTFAEIEIKQREVQKEELKDEILESFGPYGSQIADYTAKGGDPDLLIDIFKEQQRVGNLSVDTEDSQRDVVFKHQTQFLGKSADSANRYIKSLIADAALEDEAKESKELMEKDLKAQEQELKDTQDNFIKQQKALQKQNLDKFSNDVVTLVNKKDDIPAEEKKELIKSLTVFNKTLKNGTPVNDFYFKFAEFRKDLPNYLNLVRMVLNPERYIKSVGNKGKTEQSEKAFNLVRTANQTKKSKSVSQDGDDKKERKSTFKLLY